MNYKKYIKNCFFFGLFFLFFSFLMTGINIDRLLGIKFLHDYLGRLGWLGFFIAYASAVYLTFPRRADAPLAPLWVKILAWIYLLPSSFLIVFYIIFSLPM